MSYNYFSNFMPYQMGTSTHYADSFGNNLIGSMSMPIFQMPVSNFNMNWSNYNSLPMYPTFGNYTMPSTSLTSSSASTKDESYQDYIKRTKGINTNSSTPLSTESSPSKGKNVSFTEEEKKVAKEKVAEWYSKATKTTESVSSTIPSAIQFAIFENAQNFKHPIDAIKASRDANKMFDLKNNPELNKLWKSDKELMQNAYSQVQVGNRRMASKWGNHFWSNWFTKPLEGNAKLEEEKLLKDMKDALASVDKLKICEATEKLKAARGMDGKIPRLCNWISNLGDKQKIATDVAKWTPKERVVQKTTEISSNVGKYNKTLSMTAGKKALSVGSKIWKEWKGFAILDGFVETITKVIPAYRKKGTESGNKQLLQSTAKVGLSCLGWSVGRIAGSAIGTKVGAAIGSCICPGLGTAIGAGIGFLGGCLGSYLAEKLVDKLIPVDEATKIANAENLETDTGKQELISLIEEKQKNGEEIPQDLINATSIAYSA